MPTEFWIKEWPTEGGICREVVEEGPPKNYRPDGDDPRFYKVVSMPSSFLEPDCDDIEYKLARLIMEHEIFCNNGWWYKEEGKPWQEDAITLHAGCNDIFAWGCADSEDVKHGDVNDIYAFWKHDPDHGVAAWCIMKRKQMPQRPVEKMFREHKAHLWDLDALVRGEPGFKNGQR